MALRSAADAAQRAAQWLEIPTTGISSVHRIRRLDRPNEAYYLVQAGTRLLCLDEVTEDRIAWAESLKPAVPLDAVEARSRAGVDPGARAELVWTPCSATMSLLDPLWEIQENDRVIHVDQRGRRWDQLPHKQPGGGPG